MKIEILTYLEENPIKHGVHSDYPIEGIPLSEIEALETKYNNGNLFPKALRELLFLAGDYCYVLDYGAFDSQDRLQESQRNWMTEFYTSIPSTFFIVNLVSDMENFSFVYADDTDDDPIVYNFTIGTGEIYELERLKSYINSSIDMVKQGLNPF